MQADTDPGLIPLEGHRRKRVSWVKRWNTWWPIVAAVLPFLFWLGVIRKPWATPEELAALETRMVEKFDNLPAKLIEALKANKEK